MAIPDIAKYLPLTRVPCVHIHLLFTPSMLLSSALDKAQRSFFFYICPFFFVNWPRGLESVFCSPLFCDHIFDTGTLLYGFFSLKGVLVIFASSLFSLPFFNINCYTHICIEHKIHRMFSCKKRVTVQCP